MTDHEILTIDQFAERMQISRSTAYSWVADGLLGAYLIRHKAVVRIVWSVDLLVHLQTICAQHPVAPKSVLRRRGTGGPSKIALDAGYLESRCSPGSMRV